MTRHGRNATASSVYSYHERRKDQKVSGYGTLHERLGADSIKEFDCCCLTLQPCREPVVTPNGYVFDKEAILEYILQQKRENIRKLKEWDKQRRREQEELAEIARAERQAETEKFKAEEGTPAHMGSYASLSDADLAASASTKKKSVSNMVGGKNKQLPSFWIPALQQSAKETKMDRPEQKVLCPMSKVTLKMKDLIPIKFTVLKDGDTKSEVAKKVRYMCPITHDVLTNVTPCAVLKTSGNVVTMDCIEQIIMKDWIDPTNNKLVQETDIIPLQRGGTGFSTTNDVRAKLTRPAMELQ